MIRKSTEIEFQIKKDYLVFTFGKIEKSTVYIKYTERDPEVLGSEIKSQFEELYNLGYLAARKDMKSVLGIK